MEEEENLTKDDYVVSTANLNMKPPVVEATDLLSGLESRLVTTSTTQEQNNNANIIDVNNIDNNSIEKAKVETTTVDLAVKKTETKVDNLEQIEQPEKELDESSSEKKADKEAAPPEKKKIAVQVEYGNRLINTLGIHYFNDNLYFYKNSVYAIITDNDLSSCIIKYINPATEQSVCKKVIFYIKNILRNDETVKVNTDVVNFKNCLFDLKTQTAMEHTPNIFTLNQLAIDYNPSLPYNQEVEKYLDEISNHNVLRRKALLQIIGYLMTSKNNIEKIIIIYGPSASNGKSSLLKIIGNTIGSNNICYKSIEEFDKQFGADGMEFKLLNISAELPQTRIKDVSVLKKTVTGDTFEASIKFEKSKTISNTYIKHLYASNFLPDVADTTNGYYRRLHIFMLDNKFDTKTSTFDVNEFCTQENLNYLGNLAFKEYLEMVNSGVLEFANSEESEKILEEYRVENDTVLSFLTDKETGKTVYGNDVKRDVMLRIYKDYCRLNDLKPLTKNFFYRELREKYQFEEKHKNGNTEIDFYRELPVSKDAYNK